MKLIWMFFWEFIFMVFILPWAWFPIVLELWEDDEPKWIRWVMNQATGRFQLKF